MIRGALPLAAALVLGPAATASAADVAIGIPARYFLPSSLQVVVGDTVSWHNSDHDTHNLVAVDGEFDSGLLGTRELRARLRNRRRAPVSVHHPPVHDG